jgi:hypothetical protein
MYGKMNRIKMLLMQALRQLEVNLGVSQEISQDQSLKAIER